MKRIVILVAAVLVSLFTQAQHKHIDDLFDEFSKIDGVTSVNINGTLIRMATVMDSGSIDKAEREMMKNVNEIQILSFDEASADVIRRFSESASKLSVAGFHQVMSVNEANQKVNMWMKGNDDRIEEFLLVVTGNDPALIRIRGNLKKSDLSGLSHMGTGMKHK